MKNLLDTLVEILFNSVMIAMTVYVILSLLTLTSWAGDIPHNEKVVASTILAEARGEGEAGMYAVGCVILQRSINNKLSPDKVCFQKYQFSCWNNTKNVDTYSKLLDTKEGKYAQILAIYIIQSHKDNKKYLDLNSTGNATHYYSTKSMNNPPYWAKGLKPVKVIKNHSFYKL